MPKAAARRPWGKLQVERIEDKLGLAFERHYTRLFKRFRDRVRRKYQPAADYMDDDLELGTVDDYSLLEDQIRAALKVTMGLAENRAKMEGHYKTAAIQNRLDTGLAAQLAYLKGAEDDMRTSMTETVNDIIDRQGPDLNAMMVQLEQAFPITVARAHTIAVTETEKVYGWGYADILEENGWTHCRWRVSPDEKVCPDCQDLDGEVMTLDGWRDQFPAHPNCRCWNEGYKGEWTGY
jgi:SPP1 gp7 family putative phage head morphogenesis protein